MFDHILKWDTVEQARSALPSYCSQDEQGTWRWQGGILSPEHENFRGIIARAVWNNSDPMNPVLISPEQVLPGYWLGYATADVNESMSLRALPNDACRVVLDRENSGKGAQNWRFLYISPAVNPADLAAITFEPIFAGSPY